MKKQNSRKKAGSPALNKQEADKACLSEIHSIK